MQRNWMFFFYNLLDYFRFFEIFYDSLGLILKLLRFLESYGRFVPRASQVSF